MFRATPLEFTKKLHGSWN